MRLALCIVASLTIGAANKSAVVKSFKTPSGSTVVNLITLPDAGFQVNKDAPWSLKITESSLTQESSRLEYGLPGYVLEFKGKGKFTYRLQAFFCKEDKSECIRTTFDGSYLLP